jgi:ethanolamine utilization protein EutN
MQLGRVVGHAVSSVKHPTLVGWRLLIVQMMNEDGKADGEPILAIDNLGASPGTRVLATTDAVLVRELTGVKNSPIRWSIMGLVDE